MAAEHLHLEQARYNEALARFLLNDYQDWAITVAFYAAVHYVEAWFATRRLHTRSDEGHQVRADRLRHMSTLVCFAAYTNLRTASNQVRYLELWQHNTNIARDYFSDEQVRMLLEQDLATVRTELGY